MKNILMMFLLASSIGTVQWLATKINNKSQLATQKETTIIRMLSEYIDDVEQVNKYIALLTSLSAMRDEFIDTVKQCKTKMVPYKIALFKEIKQNRASRNT